jgi:hypothetical protein
MEIPGNWTQAVKPIARCYTGWAIPTMYATFGSQHWHTFLSLFLNTYVLTSEVPIGPSGNRFPVSVGPIYREFPNIVLIFLDLIFQQWSTLLAPLTCPLFSSCRSQWLRGLRHELSSPAPTLRSWVRIPLRHGCLCVFCVRLFCVYI